MKYIYIVCAVFLKNGEKKKKITKSKIYRYIHISGKKSISGKAGTICIMPDFFAREAAREYSYNETCRRKKLESEKAENWEKYT